MSVLKESESSLGDTWWGEFSSVQFSSITQSCVTPCDPMNHSTPVLPVHHQLPEFTQTHVHRVSDAIQPSYPLSSPFPPAFNLPQHQGLFKWISSLHQVAKVLELQLQHQSFQWTLRTDLLAGSPCSPRDSQESTNQKGFRLTQIYLISISHLLNFIPPPPTHLHQHTAIHSLLPSSKRLSPFLPSEPGFTWYSFHILSVAKVIWVNQVLVLAISRDGFWNSERPFISQLSLSTIMDSMLRKPEGNPRLKGQKRTKSLYPQICSAPGPIGQS